MRNIHRDPDTRDLSAQLYYMQIMVCQEGAQKLLEHAGDTVGGRTAVCLAAGTASLRVPR